eukprot:TRINITY_DN1233_c0_g1_i9.p4 TRINITY_DN1233_c0_g1~~TRINITY_DN1233_c0_g1_i9.p4  ORF type:complete len:130 (+),score=5.72 TRINITY_DN1233_c0_g1_i9:382-771(+)
MAPSSRGGRRLTATSSSHRPARTPANAAADDASTTPTPNASGGAPINGARGAGSADADEEEGGGRNSTGDPVQAQMGGLGCHDGRGREVRGETRWKEAIQRRGGGKAGKEGLSTLLATWYARRNRADRY